MAFWISITILFLWLIAKAVGLIHTPWFVEMVPYVTGFIALASILKEGGKLINKLENVISDLGTIKLELKDMRFDIKEIRNDLHSLDKRVAVLEV